MNERLEVAGAWGRWSRIADLYRALRQMNYVRFRFWGISFAKHWAIGVMRGEQE